MDDVLERADRWLALDPLNGDGSDGYHTTPLIRALAAEVRALRARVAELEEDKCWISDRCATCGHRFAYPADHCPQCGVKVGPTEPDVYPELCECPRCIVARNVAMDAALSARGGISVRGART